MGFSEGWVWLDLFAKDKHLQEKIMAKQLKMYEIKGPGGRCIVNEHQVERYKTMKGYKVLGVVAQELGEPLVLDPGPKDDGPISAATVNGMTKKDMKTLAADKDIDVSGMNAADMKVEIIHRLDLE